MLRQPTARQTIRDVQLTRNTPVISILDTLASANKFLIHPFRRLEIPTLLFMSAHCAVTSALPRDQRDRRDLESGEYIVWLKGLVNSVATRLGVKPSVNTAYG
jgi:hypothetical protein